MNVGVYSFEIMKFKELEFLNTNSMFMIGIEDIYLYSENNAKERIKEKTIFEKMLNDYKSEKIKLIIIKKLDSLGNNKYEKKKKLKELLENNYRFYCFEGNIHNLNTGGKIFTKNLIAELEENTRGSVIKNKHKDVNRKNIYNRKESKK